MKSEALNHFLNSIPPSVATAGIAVDITPRDGKQQVLELQREIFTFDAKYNDQTDFVLCVYETAQDGRIDELLKQGAALLSPTGYFFLLISGIDDSTVVYNARHYGLSVSNMSIDQGDNPLHFFVFEHEKYSDNIVEQQQSTCDRSTPQCHVPPGQGLPKCCLSHLSEMLSFVAQFCDDNGICYWINNGTLLGAARHGKLIPWDTNANIAYLQSDESKMANLMKMCSVSGYYLVNGRNVKKLCYSRKNLICVRIVPWSVAGKIITNNNDTIALSHIRPLEKILLDGKEFNCPNDYQTILADRYGADWRTPHNLHGRISAIK